MDQHYIEVLEYLEPEGIGVYTNLSPCLMAIFPLEGGAGNSELEVKVKGIRVLLSSMSNHIKLKVGEVSYLPIGIVDRGIAHPLARVWIDEYAIEAHITSKGLQYLNEHRNHKLNTSLSESVIETNQATTLLYRRQNRLYYVTLLIAVLSVIFPALTYFRDATVSIASRQAAIQRDSLNHYKTSLKLLQKRYDSLEKTIHLLNKK